MSEYHEALYYSKLEEKKVSCHLCPHQCLIPIDSRGKCKARKNIDGTLYTLNYGLSLSGTSDPIEKKPLYHFLPGTCAYSFGTVGCNLFCDFCQNWHISRASPEEMKSGLGTISSEKALKKTLRSNCPSIAYTYNEPIIWFEWVLETSKLMKKNGIKNILVTNGYIEVEPLKELLPFIDAANIDLKGDAGFYKELCKVSHSEVVLRTCKLMQEANVHIELTTLLVTNKNDSQQKIAELVETIKSTLGTEVPLHFSRYFPNYKLDLSPTPIEQLYLAKKIALDAGISYVYLGNVHNDQHSNTYCKHCGALLINRTSYHTIIEDITNDGRCRSCQAITNIVMK